MSRARRAAAVATVALTAALLVLLAAAPAVAHAVLVRSTPADGSRLSSSPAAVRLVFDEPVRLVPGAARVLAGDGSRADAGNAATTGDGSVLRIPLRPDLPRGAYTVTWRVISADSHPVAGSISFGVRHAAAPDPASAAATASPLDPLAATARGLGYAGCVGLIGIPAVALALWPSSLRRRRVRRLIAVGGALVAADALTQALIAGPTAAGSGWAGLARLDGLGNELGSPDGLALLVRAGAAVLATVAVLAGPPARAGATRGPGRPPGLLAWGAPSLAVALCLALVGHAAAGTDAVLAVASTTVHVLAMSLWLGGVALLLVDVGPRLARVPRVHPHVLRRWSYLAFGCVAALVLSGEFQALRMLRPLDALTGTDYGRVLVIKVALVLAALAAAVIAQRALVRPGPAAPRVPGRRIRIAVLAESAALVGVLIATAVLVAEPSPASVYGPSVVLSAPLGASGSLRVDVATTHHGPQRITVSPLDARGDPDRIAALSGQLASTDAGVAAIDVRFRETADGRWTSVDATAPVAGDWTLTLSVQTASGVGYATRAAYRVW